MPSLLCVEKVLSLHSEAVIRWHAGPIDQPYQGIYAAICQQHAFNFQLWHEEDQARAPRAADSVIAGVKRRIDKLNQHRNDWIERIDEQLAQGLHDHAIQPTPDARQNTETPGSVCDRLSILALRIYHLLEQFQDDTQSSDIKEALQAKLLIARSQQQDLLRSFRELIDDIESGTKRHKLYRQLKLYNDPKFNPVLYKGEG